MSSKFFYRAVVLCLLAMLVSPFFVKTPEGKPIMTLDDMFSFDPMLLKQRYRSTINTFFGWNAKNITNQDETLDKEKLPSDVTKFYKWQDENGDWHFSDVKSDSFKAEAIRINHNRNILGFDDVNKESAAVDGKILDDISEKRTDKLSDKEKVSPLEGGAKNYFKKMTHTYDDANAVQEKIDQNHQKKLDVLNNL